MAELLEALPGGQPRDKDDDDAFRRAGPVAGRGPPVGRGGRARTWSVMVAASRSHNHVVYDLLGVHGLEDGASRSTPRPADVVAELEAKGLPGCRRRGQGRLRRGLHQQEGTPPADRPEGRRGYNYTTSDLAAVRHRVEQGADGCSTSSTTGQASTSRWSSRSRARRAGCPTMSSCRHVPFGLVLGEDGKRLRTRSGDNVRLLDLLREAVDRARDFVVARAEERGERSPTTSRRRGHRHRRAEVRRLSTSGRATTSSRSTAC